MLPSRLSRPLQPLLRQRYLPRLARPLHSSPTLPAIKPFLLADIGEGIRECEVIQWFVEPEARVEEFDKLCEVQSDKASVEITSRYEGVVKTLHYQAGDMAIVGKALCDIDVLDEDIPAGDAPLEVAVPLEAKPAPKPAPAPTGAPPTPSGLHRALATPAVRRLSRELGVAVTDITGTGKDGRVLKDDVAQFAARRTPDSTPPAPPHPAGAPSASLPASASAETPTPLTPIQAQMFRAMTRSLTIPHFLYADDVAVDSLAALRKTLSGQGQKLTYMPFIIKAVSEALRTYPLLNARVDASGARPQLLMRNAHNIGVAMDTPAGLLVPNIKNVETLNVLEIAVELQRLQTLALAGKLGREELSGGTITVSNIGGIGGTVVAPVIVDSEVAILGVSRARKVPVYNERDEVVPRTQVGFSWSADHRVVDGATMARCAQLVKEFVEEPGKLLVNLR